MRRAVSPAPLDDDTQTAPDAELGARVREAGDEAALVELYRRHRTAVLAYAGTFARDPHTAEDLAAETFARTIRAVRAGRGPKEAWRPYLLSVVRHTAGQWAVSARRTELTDDFERWFGLTPSVGAGPDGPEEWSGETHMIEREERSMVLRAFRSLPERWQAALWHSVVEGESATRIGVLLGITPSGVTSLTARAREALREAYLTAHAESGGAAPQCRRYAALIGAAVRRPGRRVDRQLQRHLAECGRCRSVLTELTDLNGRLGAVLPAGLLLWGASDYLAATPSTSAGAGSALSASPTTAAGSASPSLPLVAAGAAAVTTFVLGGLLLLPGEERPPSPPSSAALPSGPTSPGPSTGPGPRPTHTPTSTPARSTSRPPTATASPTPSGTERATTPARLLSPSPPSPSPSPGTDGSTRLRSAATGQCMEVPAGAGPQAGPRQAPCDGGPQQRWHLEGPGGDNRHARLRNAGTGLCLANSGTQVDDSPVVQTECSSSDLRQLWTVHAPEGAGEARFIQSDGVMFLGLNDWANAADGLPHTSDIGTNHHYYGSPSFGFLYDGTLGGAPSAGR